LASSSLTAPKQNGHIALLYDKQEQLNAHVAEYINEGLKRGQLCVYASVHFRDEDYVQQLASLIPDYEGHIKRGNLLIIDLAPYYICSLLGDIKPFEEAKKLFTDLVKDRADKHVRFVGDGTGFLFKNKHFDECDRLEQWWQEKPFEGSCLCPYLKPFFNSFPHDVHSKHVVVANHDIVLDISEDASTQQATLPREGITADSKIVKGDHD